MILLPSELSEIDHEKSSPTEFRGDWDDHAEIRDIHRVVVGSFENGVDNDDLSLIYHRDNGLNGKVSRVEIDVP